MVFSPVQLDIRIRFSTPCTRSSSGSLARSVSFRACGPCTASNGICHTRRFSGLCEICPAADRRHRNSPCLRAQADCVRAISVAHAVVQQRLGASFISAQRHPWPAAKLRSGLAIQTARRANLTEVLCACFIWILREVDMANPPVRRMALQEERCPNSRYRFRRVADRGHHARGIAMDEGSNVLDQLRHDATCLEERRDVVEVRLKVRGVAASVVVEIRDLHIRYVEARRAAKSRS